MSPTIFERLAGQEGVLAPEVDDWRAMVDSVAIDAAYDGTFLDMEVIDLPERRTELVTGAYRVPRPTGSTLPIAVRITDMLGEEVLVIEKRGLAAEGDGVRR